jgi:hypothetical protein
MLIQLKEIHILLSFNNLAISPRWGKGCIVVGVTRALKECILSSLSFAWKVGLCHQNWVQDLVLNEAYFSKFTFM